MAQNHNAASSHIFTAMVSHTLHYSQTAGISDSKPFSCHTVHKYLSAGGPVQGYVSDDDIFFGLEAASFGRVYDQLAAGKPFSEIVVAVAYQFQCKALGNESAEALAACALAQNAVGIILQ